VARALLRPMIKKIVVLKKPEARKQIEETALAFC
jgi:hypothetical protein